MNKIIVTYTCPHCREEGFTGDVVPERYSPRDAELDPRTIIHACTECNKRIVLEYAPMIKADAFKIDR